MSQHYVIDRLDKRKWFPKTGVGKVSSQDHVLYHSSWAKRGFTLSDPISQRLILTCKPEGSWWNLFLCRGTEVFKTDQAEICRIQYSVRKLRGELIINDRAYSLKTTWIRNGICMRKRSCKYEWEVCSIDLSYDDGMCVASVIIEENIDHLPYIAVAYYLWMQEEFCD